MTFTVDVHHHLIADFYRRATELSDDERAAIFNGTATTLLSRLAAYVPVDMGRTVGTDNGHGK
jgi:hypothetical protein